MLLQGVQVKLEQADEFNDISNFFTFTVQENIPHSDWQLRHFYLAHAVV